MPQIKQYDAPDSLGLRPTEVGITATAAAARRVGAEYSEAASAQTTAGHAIGSGIKVAGDEAARYVDHQQIVRGAKGFAALMAAKSKEWDDAVKSADPDDPTIAPKFMTGLEGDLEKFQGGFFTEGAQKWADSHVASFRQHMFQKTTADMASAAGHAAVVNTRQTINSLSNAVRSDPASLDFTLKTLESSVDGMIGSSPNLTGAAAQKARAEILQKGKEDIVKSAALGYIEKTGKVPPWASDERFSPYISGAELKQFEQSARYYKRLADNEDKTARQERERQERYDVHVAVNDLELSTLPKNVGDPVKLPPDYWEKVRKIGLMPGAALEPGRVHALIRNGEIITQRMNKPEVLARISQPTTVELLKRIRSGEMVDNNEIYDAYGESKLTTSHFNFLIKEFDAARTPDGQRLNAAKTQFFKAVGPSVDKSNPLMGKIDQDGKLNLYRLEMDINQKIAEYRAAGKNPHDLLDPSKPDYMGRPEALAPYQKTLTQSISDTTRRLSGQTPPGAPAERPPPVRPPRKPGESADDYLKRIGL